MDVSTPSSLDLACPQAKTGIKKHVHMLRERGVHKTKYGHSSIMVIIRIANKLYHITSYEQVTIHHTIEVSSINCIENQQTMFSVNIATTIHQLLRKGHVSEPFWQVHILNHTHTHDC